MKCRNEAQTTRQTCNDVDYVQCDGCSVLWSHDCSGGWFTRCDNRIPIKFGETVESLRETDSRKGRRTSPKGTL